MLNWLKNDFEDLSSMRFMSVSWLASLRRDALKRRVWFHVLSKAERIIDSSTGSVYASNIAVPIRENGELGPRPKNYYGWCKLQAERWIRNYKKFTPHVILLYGYIYDILKSWGAIGDWM